MLDPRCEAQVRLLLQCLPLLRNRPDFALKGRTAINLFVQHMPRVSVDIDLSYLPLRPRTESLAAIEAELRDLKHEMARRIPDVAVEEQRAGGQIVRLRVVGPRTSIKIEPNLVFRGSVYPPAEKDLCAEASSTSRPLFACRPSAWQTCMAASCARRWIASTQRICMTSAYY